MHFCIEHTDFGHVVVGWRGETDPEVFWCALGDDVSVLQDEFTSAFPKAEASNNPSPMQALKSVLRGGLPHLRVVPNGTDFQLRVWKALSSIPRGETRTYAEIATLLGMDAAAARAVGTACGANTIALFVPCHRAVGSSGDLTGFRWGVDRKRRLLEHEGALQQLTMF